MRLGTKGMHRDVLLPVGALWVCLDYGSSGGQMSPELSLQPIHPKCPLLLLRGWVKRRTSMDRWDNLLLQGVSNLFLFPSSSVKTYETSLNNSLPSDQKGWWINFTERKCVGRAVEGKSRENLESDSANQKNPSRWWPSWIVSKCSSAIKVVKA